VWVAFNLFKSAMTQKPLIRKFLPIELSPEAAKAGAPKSGMTLFDPSEGEVLDVLVGKLLDMRLYSALVSSAAGEHGARMTAMDNSTRNCESLIDRYTLLRNRARQATITKELIEIIGGAEALH
jgi:F-type H+-transporting ATPase subunit gamma